MRTSSRVGPTSQESDLKETGQWMFSLCGVGKMAPEEKRKDSPPPRALGVWELDLQILASVQVSGDIGK